MQLTKVQKTILKNLKKQNPNIQTIVIEGSAVVAWNRVFPTSKMIDVSVSYFDRSEDDKFRKKTGEYFALDRLCSGQAVQLPLGAETDEDIADVLLSMFDI